MIKTLDYNITSCNDEELNIKRDSKLHFNLWFDDEKEIKALFFISSGLGEDSNHKYKDKLAKFTTSEYPVAVCSVDYRCIANREPLGATLDYDYIDKFILKTACKSIDFPISDDDIKDTQSIKNTIARINCHIIKMKKEAKILNKFILKLSTSLIPARNEYNNFGIMSAMDIINSLLHIKKNPPFKMGGGSGSFFNGVFSWRLFISPCSKAYSLERTSCN
ncbi:DUF2920 family protein [Campylobacter sp. LR264d]|uniref:DUF2920 family protein n=1 Tax=Campylobacter sp. LR264d TaxID=2593544 RepID=UPI00123A6071|nr:DUF2920 family protein [Campylobacter sp. LR264d]KAA6234444.1 DUF2920 family protein [Campylobacter sp. LR264d]